MLGSGVNDPLSPIKQTLYPQFEVYNVDINNPLCDTKAHVAQCPPKNTCYCGRGCAAHIDRRHADGDYECVVCEYHSDNPRHVWKHYRAQHLHIHIHVCKIKGCRDDKNNKLYGNDEQHTVWAHMPTAYKIQNPMSCPKCKNIDEFSSKKKMEHIPKCEELEGKTTKKFGCDFLGCGKRYTTQVALDTHKSEVHNPDKIVSEPELQYMCEHCANDFATKGSLTRHIKRKHSSKDK